MTAAEKAASVQAPDQEPVQETVILLGSDTPIGLAVVRDLGRHGYRTVGIGRSATALAGFSRHCHHHVARRDGEDGLLAQIMALAEAWQATYLLAVGESDLLFLNRHREALETKIKLLIPSADKLAQVLDKAVCQAHARAVGIEVPRTLLVSSLDEARAAASELSYPVVLKWADPNRVASGLAKAGLALVKTAYAQNTAALLDRLTPYAPLAAFPMIQEYCPGHGLGQMFLVEEGRVLLEFQHERLHEWPPEGGVSTLCRSVPLSRHREARARSRALLARLRWSGVAMVEYRYDPGDERYYFMEINGRFWGSLPLAIAAGVPFAAGLVAANGKGRADPSCPSRAYGSVTACYWIPETKRLLRLFLQRRAIQDPFYRPDPLASLWTYVSLPFRPSTHWFVFQLSDPRPFFADLMGVLAKLWAMIRSDKRAD